MKNVKKVLALLMALTMVFAFAACGGSSESVRIEGADKNDKPPENNDRDFPPPPPPAPPPNAKQRKNPFDDL